MDNDSIKPIRPLEGACCSTNRFRNNLIDSPKTLTNFVGGRGTPLLGRMSGGRRTGNPCGSKSFDDEGLNTFFSRRDSLNDRDAQLIR
jgi:hypothetical protein